MDRIRQICEQADSVAEDNAKRDTRLSDLDTLTNTLHEKSEQLEEAFKDTKAKVKQDFLTFEGKITKTILEFE